MTFSLSSLVSPVKQTHATLRPKVIHPLSTLTTSVRRATYTHLYCCRCPYQLWIYHILFHNGTDHIDATGLHIGHQLTFRSVTLTVILGTLLRLLLISIYMSWPQLRSCVRRACSPHPPSSRKGSILVVMDAWHIFHSPKALGRYGRWTISAPSW